MSMIELRDILLRFFVFVFLLIFLGMVLEGCTDKCESTNTYFFYEPVYTTLEEIRSSVRQEPPKDMAASGKIYIYGNTLFVNEPGKGVHVINNADKRNPKPLSFINIPGNFDIAAKGNFLYADSYLDLLAFDLSDLNDITLTKRIENVYTSTNSLGVFPDPQLGVVTDWVQSATVENFEGDCGDISGGFQPWREGVLMTADFANNAFSPQRSANLPNNVGPAGIGGSMARFAITGNNMYAVDDRQLHVFDISNLADPTPGNKVDLGWGIETIFPYKENLFIGANNGMHIYDNSDPDLPAYMSSFLHVTACDPVVVNDEYAFVTLRSGNACNGFVNQLDVVDIRNLNSPVLVESYPMDNPHGLGIDGNDLFLCEGEFGLKVFNIEDVNTISDNLIKRIEDVHAFDVIPFQNILIMIGEDGLYQFDYSDPVKLPLLSHIPVVSSEE